MRKTSINICVDGFEDFLWLAKLKTQVVYANVQNSAYNTLFFLSDDVMYSIVMTENSDWRSWFTKSNIKVIEADIQTVL